MIRRLFIAIALLAFGVSAFAALTTQQLQTLKTAINANPIWVAYPMTGDGYFDLAKVLNLQATPSFTVWKTNVSINAVGKAFNGTELAGLTTGNQTRLQTLALYLASGVDPSNAGNRAFFDDVFSGAGGTNTRAALLALWKRFATSFEKIYATGTGSDASPATLVVEGAVTASEVQAARELP